MKSNVLIFPCGSEIGLEINRALANSTHVELFGGSSVLNHGKYVYKNYIDGLPFVDSPNFIEEINNIVDQYNIDLIYPAHDSVLLELSKRSNEIKCEVIASPYETCKICRSKGETYRVFEGKLNTPKVYRDSTTIDNYPIFLKPDVGEGAKGTKIAYNKTEVDFYISKNNSLLILEYLPGKEYTIDCFTDNEGELRFVGGRERARIQGGISVHTNPVSDIRFLELADKINNTIKLVGAWFFQVKERSNGELVLMEIAPRIAGSMGMNRYLGVNLPLLGVFIALNKQIEIINNSYEIEMDRALINRCNIEMSFAHVYIDLDDTIVVNNQVNTVVISFLYQCMNKEISIHLISKHCGDIKKYLEHYRLEPLFNSITWISSEDQKYKYINEENSIFIDDSFLERKIVAEKLGIPTFDVSMVECLLDWRI